MQVNSNPAHVNYHPEFTRTDSNGNQVPETAMIKVSPDMRKRHANAKEVMKLNETQQRSLETTTAERMLEILNPLERNENYSCTNENQESIVITNFRNWVPNSVSLSLLQINFLPFMIGYLSKSLGD